jgi:SAM domain (Sterile alpha motif)
MQQIADWLGKLGLSEYAQRFAENDIDFTILGDLTDQDLEKIGIASLGHRRKLLRAIANLETIEKSAPAVAVPIAPCSRESKRWSGTARSAPSSSSLSISARSRSPKPRRNSPPPGRLLRWQAAVTRSRRSMPPAQPGGSPMSRPLVAPSSNGWRASRCRGSRCLGSDNGRP